jgi:hypothetical protein
LLALDLPESVPQFAANRLGNLQQDAAVFRQREQTEPLALVHHHHFQRRRQQFPSALPNAPIQLLAPAQDQVRLDQSVGEQNEQHLIDNQ